MIGRGFKNFGRGHLPQSWPITKLVSAINTVGYGLRAKKAMDPIELVAFKLVDLVGREHLCVFWGSVELARHCLTNSLLVLQIEEQHHPLLRSRLL